MNKFLSSLQKKCRKLGKADLEVAVESVNMDTLCNDFDLLYKSLAETIVLNEILATLEKGGEVYMKDDSFTKKVNFERVRDYYKEMKCLLTMTKKPLVKERYDFKEMIVLEKDCQGVDRIRHYKAEV